MDTDNIDIIVEQYTINSNSYMHVAGYNKDDGTQRFSGVYISEEDGTCTSLSMTSEFPFPETLDKKQTFSLIMFEKL